MVIGPIQLNRVQFTLGTGQHRIQRLCTQPHHQNLTFWITKTHVVFNQTRLPIFDHKTRIQHTLIRRATTGHFIHCWLYNFSNRFGCHRIRHHRCGGIGTHATCVWPLVTIKNTLVILGCANRQDIFTVRQDKETGFFAVHEFFDHNFCASRAKGTAKYIA